MESSSKSLVTQTKNTYDLSTLVQNDQAFKEAGEAWVKQAHQLIRAEKTKKEAVKNEEEDVKVFKLKTKKLLEILVTHNSFCRNSELSDSDRNYLVSILLLQAKQSIEVGLRCKQPDYLTIRNKVSYLSRCFKNQQSCRKNITTSHDANTSLTLPVSSIIDEDDLSINDDDDDFKEDGDAGYFSKMIVFNCAENAEAFPAYEFSNCDVNQFMNKYIVLCDGIFSDQFYLLDSFQGFINDDKNPNCFYKDRKILCKNSCHIKNTNDIIMDTNDSHIMVFDTALSDYRERNCNSVLRRSSRVTIVKENTGQAAFDDNTARKRKSSSNTSKSTTPTKLGNFTQEEQDGLELVSEEKVTVNDLTSSRESDEKQTESEIEQRVIELQFALYQERRKLSDKEAELQRLQSDKEAELQKLSDKEAELRERFEKDAELQRSEQEKKLQSEPAEQQYNILVDLGMPEIEQSLDKIYVTYPEEAFDESIARIDRIASDNNSLNINTHDSETYNLTTLKFVSHNSIKRISLIGKYYRSIHREQRAKHIIAIVFLQVCRSLLLASKQKK